MYKIGEVSNMVKISTRMLRYYDKENILNSSHISDSGYRYYTDEDIEVLLKIKNLRRYEFSYKEIKKIFDDSLYYDRELYLRKIEELKLNVDKYRDMIFELENNKSNTNTNTIIINDYIISICEREKENVLCKRLILRYDEVEKFIEDSYKYLLTNKVARLGSYYLAFCKNENLGENLLEVEYIQAVIDIKNVPSFENRSISKGTYITTMHFGSYEGISKAYASLYKWAKNNNYDIKGDFMERYFVDSSMVSSDSEFVTEIIVKVLKL